MTLKEILRDGLSKFNAKQEATKRKPLTSLEGTMMVEILHGVLAQEMGQLRDSLESAASQANIETQRDLDWATDIIVSFIRGENKMSVRLEDEKIAKLSAGFGLRVDRGEGRTELELFQEQDNE